MAETSNPSAAPLGDYPVVVELPVQWGEMDALRHVNNIVYFRWFETARIEYMRTIGVDDQPEGESLGMILAAINCNFRRLVEFPDTDHVGAKVSRIGRTSMTMDHAVYSHSQAELAAEGSSTVVLFNYETGKPQEVPPAVREAIAKREANAPVSH